MKYSILQIDDSYFQGERCPYGFMDWLFAQEHGFDIAHYKVTGTYDMEGKPSLEDIFTCHNRDDRPDKDIARSFSVSDIVFLDDCFYYCNPCGWKNIDDIISYRDAARIIDMIKEAW